MTNRKIVRMDFLIWEYIRENLREGRDVLNNTVTFNGCSKVITLDTMLEYYLNSGELNFDFVIE